MPQFVLFPDAENLFREGINNELPTVLGTPITGYTKRPPTLPTEFIVITRTGGVQRDIITDQPVITLDAYAQRGGSPHEDRAMRILQHASAWLTHLPNRGALAGVPIYQVEQLSGPYRNPDPLAPNHARFTGLFQIALRGQTVNT